MTSSPASRSAAGLPPERLLGWSLGTALITKLIAAAIFPLTGDEAYFIQWGRELAGSYYDHGPITGWWLWALLQVSDHVVWLRLPAILTSIVVAWMLWRAWRRYDRERAALSAALLAWSLPSVLGILMTTDTPLLLFSVAAVIAAARGDRTGRARDYVLAGAFLGLAFLAKYFAVLLGIGLAVWWWGLSPRRNWPAVGWLLLGVLPFAVQHMYWNFHHSWTNVMFNVFTRQETHGLNWRGPAIFAVIALWLLGPLGWALLRGFPTQRTAWRAALASLYASPAGLYVTVFLVPYAVLFSVSIVREVGVHWLLSFYPFGFALLLAGIDGQRLRRWLRPMIVFTGIHVAVALTLVALPIEGVRSHKSYFSIVIGLYPQEVLASVESYRSEYTLTTPSYAKSALFEYHARTPVPVLGPGSFHGRQDDLRTDWRSYDGAKLMLLTNRLAEAAEARAWFERSDLKEMSVRGARFYVLLGDGFQYPVFRDQVLRRVAERYYRMPDWLEDFSSGCFFRARYDLPPSSATTATP